MARHFADDILDRASCTFGVVTKENFAKWVVHWRETARQLKDELNAEGLWKSAESVEAFIHHTQPSTKQVEEYISWEKSDATE
jgi:hypothetical protein